MVKTWDFSWFSFTRKPPPRMEILKQWVHRYLLCNGIRYKTQWYTIQLLTPLSYELEVQNDTAPDSGGRVLTMAHMVGKPKGVVAWLSTFFGNMKTSSRSRHEPLAMVWIC